MIGLTWFGLCAIYVLPVYGLWGHWGYGDNGLRCKVSDDDCGDSFRKEYIEFIQSLKKCLILRFKFKFPYQLI